MNENCGELGNRIPTTFFSRWLLSDDRKIVNLGAARRDRERADRDAARAAKRAARPQREGVAPLFYWGVVLFLIFALAGGYTLIAAL